MNLVDSSGWLEYFTEGSNAASFAEPLQDKTTLLVSVINLYEVFKVVLRERDENSAFQTVALMRQGRVTDVTAEISVHGAKTSHELKIPMTDSLIYATAQLYEATLWTQDEDFDGLQGVRYLAKSGY